MPDFNGFLMSFQGMHQFWPMQNRYERVGIGWVVAQLEKKAELHNGIVYN